MSQTLYSKRMGKEIARLERKEKKMRTKEIARTDPQICKTTEEEKTDVHIFVKTCGSLWG